jgi:hypothetical protein
MIKSVRFGSTPTVTQRLQITTCTPSTDGTGHDLSAAVAARGAQIASLHSATPAPRTHEHNTTNDTTSTATPGNPRPAKDNDMASIGENAILQQLAVLKQQMAGFSTAVSPVNPTAATPDPAMLAELQALQHQLTRARPPLRNTQHHPIRRCPPRHL